MKILIINPGSTSTKISVFDETKELLGKCPVFYDSDPIHFLSF